MLNIPIIRRQPVQVHRWLPTMAACAALLFSSGVVASGSRGAGGVGSGDDYNVGKAVFYKKLACGGCPYAGRGKDAADAKQLIQELSVGRGAASGLSEEERAAAVAYLRRRFR